MREKMSNQNSILASGGVKSPTASSSSPSASSLAEQQKQDKLSSRHYQEQPALPAKKKEFDAVINPVTNTSINRAGNDIDSGAVRSEISSSNIPPHLHQHHQQQQQNNGQWVVSRKVDTHIDKKVYRTERVQRRVLPEAEWRAVYEHNPTAIVLDHNVTTAAPADHHHATSTAAAAANINNIVGSLTQPVQETRTTTRKLNYHPASSADVYVQKNTSSAAQPPNDFVARNGLEQHKQDRAGDDMYIVDDEGRLVRRNTSQVTQQEVTTITRVYRTLEPVGADYQLQPSCNYFSNKTTDDAGGGGRDGRDVDENDNTDTQPRHYQQHFESDGNVYPHVERSHEQHLQKHHHRHQQRSSQQRHHHDFNPQQQQQSQLHAPDDLLTNIKMTENDDEVPDDNTTVLYAARYDYNHYETSTGDAGAAAGVADSAVSRKQTGHLVNGDTTIDYAVTEYDNNDDGGAATAPPVPLSTMSSSGTAPHYERLVMIPNHHQNGGGGGEVVIDGGNFYADSVVAAGGNDSGPSPHDNNDGYEYDDSYTQPKGIIVVPNSNGNIPLLRDPELPEVIQFLCHWNAAVRANAAAHLAHLCYMNDAVKAQARMLGAIPLLVDMISVGSSEYIDDNNNSSELNIARKNACCALRNLTYGKHNDDNKRAFLYAGGVVALAQLYSQYTTTANTTTPPSSSHHRAAAAGGGASIDTVIELREAASATLWNLSSCDDLKRPIIDEGLTSFIGSIIDVVPAAAAAAASAAAATVDPISGQAQQQNGANLHYFNHQLSRNFHTAIFRNLSGVLRNVSSDGEHARQALRHGGTLLRALFAYLRMAVGEQDVDNKSTENCVCIVRNLAYRLQEIDDPHYDEHANVSALAGEILYAAPHYANGVQHISNTPAKSTPATTNGSNNNAAVAPSYDALLRHRGSETSNGGGVDIACFASTPRTAHKRQHQSPPKQLQQSPVAAPAAAAVAAGDIMPSNIARQVDILWSNEAVKIYLAILQHCANPDTLEAAAGIIQNITACSWRPALHVRGVVRKEKGLPILVELLRMENDRVVCSVARALRNLALDEKNRDLIGKYAMNDLLSKIPNVNMPSINKSMQRTNSASVNNSDDTVAAILATVNEAVSANQDFAREFVEHDGLGKLVRLTQPPDVVQGKTDSTSLPAATVPTTSQLIGPKTQRFAIHILHALWRKHPQLHDFYKSMGYKEAQLMYTPSNYALQHYQQQQPQPGGTTATSGTITASNTLHRPFSSQGANDEPAASGSSKGLTAVARQKQQQMLELQRHQQQPMVIVSDPTRNNDSWV